MNPYRFTNSAVLKPYWNGDDLTGRPRDIWLIDFPLGLSEGEVALFQGPFEYLKGAAYDPGNSEDTRSLITARASARDVHARERWWETYWPRPELRRRLSALRRYIVTAETAEYRLFVWLALPILPDKNLIIIARDVATMILHLASCNRVSMKFGPSERGQVLKIAHDILRQQLLKPFRSRKAYRLTCSPRTIRRTRALN